MTCRFSHSLLLVCLLSTSLLTACKKESDLPPISADQHPSPTPMVEASIPAEELAQEARFSGGLGLSKAAFALTHGEIFLCKNAGQNPPSCIEGENRISIHEFGSNSDVEYFVISPPPPTKFQTPHP